MADPTLSTQPDPTAPADRPARSIDGAGPNAEPAAAPKQTRRTRSKRRSKRRLRDLGQGPIGWLAGSTARLYLRLVFWTTRWERSGQTDLDALNGSRPLVVVVWHGRMFATPMFRPRGRRVVAMVSNNSDGDLISRFLAGFGLETVRGSSVDPRKPQKARGGARAASEGVQAVNDGAVLVVIPDGPRGPAHEAKPGVAWIAAAAGADVLPVGISFRRGKVFHSWDRFLLPWPFNNGAIVAGPRISPPAASSNDADPQQSLERFRRAIEDGLQAATRSADRLVGRTEPDPVVDPRPDASPERDGDDTRLAPPRLTGGRVR